MATVADGHGPSSLALTPPTPSCWISGCPTSTGWRCAGGMRAAGDDTPVLMLTARDAIDDRVAGSRRRRRRLPGQALRPGRAVGPAPRPAAPPGRGRRRACCASPTSPWTSATREAQARRARLHPDPDRVRPPRAVPAPPAPGPHPRGDPRPGLGLQLRLGHQLAGRLRRVPAAQDRGGERAAAASTPCAGSATCCGSHDLPDPAGPGGHRGRRVRRAGRVHRLVLRRPQLAAQRRSTIRSRQRRPTITDSGELEATAAGDTGASALRRHHRRRWCSR